MVALRKFICLIALITALALVVSCGSSGGGGVIISPGLKVTSTTPVDSDTGIANAATVSATFDREPAQSTIDSSSFTLTNGMTPVTGSLSVLGNTVSFTPDSPLNEGTLYTATLKAGVLSTSGIKLKHDYVWSFTTRVTIAPTVTSVTPANGATAVATSSKVTATFSTVMNTSTIDATSFKVTETSGGATVTGTIAFAGQTATFTPSSALQNSKSYTVTLTAGIEDQAGVAMGSAYAWSFTSADVVDSTAPTVSGLVPVDTATGISVTSPVSITFSEDIAPATVNVATVKLASSSSLVSGTIVQSGDTVIFTPTVDLAYNTAYTATITSGVADLAGNKMAAAYVSGFTTEAEPDVKAPTVTSIAPSAGNSGVPVGSKITATFSEPMDSASVTGNFTLKDTSGTPVAGLVVYDGISATFTPTASLSYDTTYTATLSWSMTDLAGNALSLYTWSFTTGSAPDAVAPTVSSTSPGAVTGVSITSPVSVAFSEKMDAETVNAATFKLSGASGLVAGTISVLGDTAILTPSAPLAYNTSYTVTITTSVADLAGNNMSAPNAWSFTTELEPDNVAPSVIITTPAGNASDVALSANIIATFSEAMDTATITAAGNFTLKDAAGSTVAGAVTYDGTSATFNPTASLAADTTYTAMLSFNVTDTSGNALSLYSWSFTTGSSQDITAPSVSAKSPGAVTGTSIASPVSVTFSEDMDASTVNEATFKLSSASGLVSASITKLGDTAILTPSAPLAYGTVYTVTITTGVADLAGNRMASVDTWSFTTESKPDTAAPSVVSTAPASGAYGISVASDITATFSEAMDKASVETAGNFTLKEPAGSTVAGTITYDGTSAIFNPAASLAYDTTYTATLSFNITDTAGNALSLYTFSFTTGSAPDAAPPTVSSTSPGAVTGVSVSSPILVTFSESMAAETINAASFKLSSTSGLVAGTGIALGSTAIFTPNAPLAYSTVYTVTITTDVTDLAGNNMALPNTWDFTTESEPDTVAPAVVITTPSNGGAGVSATSVITAAFSEAMDPTTVVVANFILKDAGGGTVGGTVSYDGISAKFTPTATLAYNAMYTATLTWGMTDLAGNPLSLYTWSFTTGSAPDVTPPTVTGISPVTGATDVPADATVKATFSEAMAAGSINQYTFTLTNGVSAVPGVVSYDGSLAIFTPLEALDYSTTYTATITTGVADTSGNNMASDKTWTFTTMSAETAGDVQDTDGDGLSDIEEMGIYNTSPILADTDGDGWSDWKELIEYNFNPANNPYRYNPLVADLPKIDINFSSSPDISLHYTTSSGTSYSESSSQTNETAASTTRSDSFEIGVAVEGRLMTDSQGVSVTGQTTWNWQTDNTTENREAFERAEGFESNNTIDTSEGEILLAVEVENTGHLAYTLENLVIGALTPDPDWSGKLNPVGNLNLDVQYNSFPATTIAPGDKREALIFSKIVDVGTAKYLLGESSPLVLKVASYQITDGDGKGFAFNQTDILAKTAKVFIDYGSYRPSESYHVATNVDPDNPEVSLGYVMNSVLHIPHEEGAAFANGTAAMYNSVAVQGLLGIRNTIGAKLDYAKRGYWLLAHAYNNGAETIVEIYDIRDDAYSLDDIHLQAGHSISMIYTEDPDMDGITTRFETSMGTRNNSQDSDGDGFLDMVDPHPNYHGNNGFQLASGHKFSLMIKTDGTLWAWGENQYGQLGLGHTNFVAVPTQVGTDKWKKISVERQTAQYLVDGLGLWYGRHAAGIKADGTLWTWGANESSQLGLGAANSGHKYSPQHVGSSRWIDVSAGNNFTLAIREDGQLFAWGDGASGRLGVGDLLNKNTPQPVNTTITNWVQVSAGYDHSAALTAGGILYLWGNNSAGQVGNNSSGVDVLSPVMEWHSRPTNENWRWKKVTTGWEHTLAIRDDGSLYGWGSNTRGQLCIGYSSTMRTNATQEDSGAHDWADVEAGLLFSSARKSDGTVWTCGGRMHGQLGDGAGIGVWPPDVADSTLSLTREATGSIWHSISSNENSTLGVLYNGTIWGWGTDHYGIDTDTPLSGFVEEGFDIFPQQ